MKLLIETETTKLNSITIAVHRKGDGSVEAEMTEPSKTGGMQTIFIEHGNSIRSVLVNIINKIKPDDTVEVEVD